MGLPTPFQANPLTTPQSQWLRGQKNIDGSPTPPPIQVAWQLNDGSDNAWQLNDGSDDAWVTNP